MNFGLPSTPSSPDIALASDKSNVIVTWVNGAIVGNTHEVWKSTDGTTFNLFATVLGSVNQYTDTTGMGSGNIWYYQIRSCNGTNCSAFTSVVSASFNYTSPNVASMSFPTLVRAFGTLTAHALAALTSISLPALKRIDGIADFSGNASLTSVTLTALVTTGTHLFLGNSNITGAFSLPALVSTGGDLQLQGNANLTSISCASLVSVAGVLAFSSTPVTSVTFTSLQTVGAQLQFTSLSALTSVSFPALTNGGTITFNGCTLLVSASFAALTTIAEFNGNTSGALTTVNIGSGVFVDGHLLNLSACALNAASVNAILARGVASSLAGYDFELAGGTNAAPSGQGVADKATLQGQGNTVNTN